MERMRSKAKIEKAVENWKRLQKESKKEVIPKLEKIVVKKKNTQDQQLKDIA